MKNILYIILSLVLSQNLAFSQESNIKPIKKVKIDKESKYEVLVSNITLPLTLSTKSAQSDAIFRAYERCIEECDSIKQRRINELECDYERLKSEYFRCYEEAQNQKRKCFSECSETKRKKDEECKENRKDEKKDCRETKRDKIRDCRETKRDEIRDCRSLKGRAKRDCKRDARRRKRDCKRNARNEKRDCIDNANNKYENCLRNNSEEYEDCISVCNSNFSNQCEEEWRAYAPCKAEYDQILKDYEDCKKICEEEKEILLDAINYNPECPEGEGGSGGTNLTLFNYSESSTVHIYKPNFTGFYELFASVGPRDSITDFIPCGEIRGYQIKDRIIDSSDFEGEISYFKGDCCKDPVSRTYIIPEIP